MKHFRSSPELWRLFESEYRFMIKEHRRKAGKSLDRDLATQYTAPDSSIQRSLHLLRLYEISKTGLRTPSRSPSPDTSTP